MNMDVVMAQTKPKKVPTTRYYGLKLHKENDHDIIEFLDSCTNIQGSIKGILRFWIRYIGKKPNDKT